MRSQNKLTKSYGESLELDVKNIWTRSVRAFDSIEMSFQLASTLFKLETIYRQYGSSTAFSPRESSTTVA